MDAAFRTLDELYKMETLRCRFLIKDVDLMRIDVDSVLGTGKVVEAHVKNVGDGWVEVNDPNNAQSVLRLQGHVIVAAGVWSAQLLPQLSTQLSAKKGISWTFSGVKKMPTNVIAPWAPYKQVVRTHHGTNTVWIGDGTAIKPENWDQAREEQIRGRIMAHVDFKYKKLELRRGLRPYMTNGFQKLGNHLHVATGGGKSGMCLAGVYANRLSNLLG
jgi:glycine/D-amino acid oxidase-like deaminating enzyme